MKRGIILFTLLALAQSKLIQLSCKDIKTFVDGHNLKRQQVAKGQVPNQPGAREMKYVVWDQELADKAAKWASLHKFDHNPDRTIPSNRFPVGENLFSSSIGDPNFVLDYQLPVDSWFNEHKDYTFGPIKMADSSFKQTGHYSQMIWADTTSIGCAVSQKFENQQNNYIVVCNYGPTGNIVDQTPYQTGKSTSLVCGNYNCKQPYGRCPA